RLPRPGPRSPRCRVRREPEPAVRSPRARLPPAGRAPRRGSRLRLGAVHKEAEAPRVELGEFFAVERAAHLAADAFRSDDPRASQSAQVPGHKRLADAKAAGELGNRLLAFGHKDLNDTEAVDVAERAVIAPQLAQAGLAQDRSPLHQQVA